MNARRIPLSLLSSVQGEEWVDRTRRPFVSGEFAYVPVKSGHKSNCTVPERHPYSGRGYQCAGDCVLIHGKAPDAGEVEEITRWAKARTVLHIKGYSDVMRIPDAAVLHGPPPGTILHREAKHSYRFDPSRVMFAQGNREEKMRISGLVALSDKEERIADMFAGIGYFTIPAAAAGGRVHAMEINPESFAFLRENADLNHLSGQIHAECGDCRDLLDGVYDRILMGHFDSAGMIDCAFEHATRGSVIHLHSIGGAEKIITHAAKEAGYIVGITKRKVKKYAPGRWHMVEDVAIQ